MTRREMQRNSEKGRDIQRNVEKCREIQRNPEKSREIQRKGSSHIAQSRLTGNKLYVYPNLEGGPLTNLK